MAAIKGPGGAGVVSRWRALLRGPGPGLGLALVWLLGLAFWRWPGLCPPSAAVLVCSAVCLALGRPSFESLVRAAMAFWLAWTTLSLYLSLFGLAGFKNPAELAAKMALGLHLILLWTPMELGGALKSFLRLFIGEKRAGLLAMALVVILKVLPGMALETQKLKETLGTRADRLSGLSRLVLLGRGLLRLEGQRSEEMARALLSRHGTAGPPEPDGVDAGAKLG